MNNKPNNISIIYFVITLIVIGCSQDKYNSRGDNSFIVDFHTKEFQYFEDFFDMKNMQIIKFEDENPLILSEKLQIEFAKDYLFIFDKGYEQLYRFDYSGKLLNKIGRSGQGPSEYLNAGFFVIDENLKTLNILCDSGSAIMIFDYDGRFLKKFATPIIVTSFDCLESNLFYYYSGYYNSPNFHRLHKADSANILQSYLPIKTQAFDMMEMNFTPMGDFGYFRETFFPAIYKYNSFGIEEIFRMEFGPCEITQKMLEEVGEPFEFFEEIVKNGFCTMTSLIAGKNNFYVVAIQQDSHATKVSHFHIDLVDSVYTRVISQENQQKENDLFSQLKPVYIDSHNNLYFVVNPVELKAFIKTNPDLLLTESVLDETFNPLILMVPINYN